MVSTADIYSNYRGILGVSHGARFVKVDLHVHTPASGDAQAKNKYNFKVLPPHYSSFSKDQKEKFKKEDIPKRLEAAREIAKEIVGGCLNKNLRLIAVTDHNTPSNTHPEDLTNTWYQLIRDAARGTNLCVLPGVEISTDDLHILVILDPKEDEPAAYTTHRINFLLQDCKFTLKEYGDYRATGMSSLFDILEYIEELGTSCIAIPAHIDGGKKAMLAVYKEPSNVFKKLLNHPNLNAVEVVKPTTPARKKIGKKSVEEYFQHLRAPDRSPVAFIQDSDGHAVKEIGKRFTYIRIGEPSFWSLKNALEDPETRIRMERHYSPATDKTSIIGMAFRKGNRKWNNIGFNPDLNCIIGKKRTKKSTVIDLILYALDRLGGNEKEDEKRLVDEKYSVNVFIQKGTDVICYSREKDGKPPKRFKLENDSFVPFNDETSLELPKKYNHRVLEELFSDKTSLMNFLDKHFFIDKKTRAYRERRDKYIGKVKAKRFEKCKSDFNNLLKNCEKLFDERKSKRLFKERGNYVEISLEGYGKKSGKYIFKARIEKGEWRGIKYEDLSNLKKENFKDYFGDKASLYVLVDSKYTRLDKLSTGERNAALMVLLMNHDAFGPLIIDEPEQYLDVGSITGVLVPWMRKLKTQQQIICVTNDEHILLSGDAEQVVATQSERKIDVITGDVNNRDIQGQVLEIFEGDELALEEKNRKLGSIILE